MTFKFIKIVLTTCKYAALLSVGALSIAGIASATLIESIAALDDGDKYRVLFVTSDTRNAVSPSIADYNDFVTDAASIGTATKDLGLLWTAVASTESVDAQVNTGILSTDNSDVTFFNTSGGIVALSGSTFWGVHSGVHISYTEHGSFANPWVYTGTLLDGTGRTGTELGQDEVHIGQAFVNGGGWVSYAGFTTPKGTARNLYAASSMSTKAANIPEPGTINLLLLGLAGLSFSRYRKQS
jgi:hypothetical protein